MWKLPIREINAEFRGTKGDSRVCRCTGQGEEKRMKSIIRLDGFAEHPPAQLPHIGIEVH
jgi:hypothetical protein